MSVESKCSIIASCLRKLKSHVRFREHFLKKLLRIQVYNQRVYKCDGRTAEVQLHRELVSDNIDVE